MTDLSGFQSIFQLGAGLSIGFSGILSLFRNPTEIELQKLAFLGKRVRALPKRHTNISAEGHAQIDNLQQEIDELTDDIQKESDSTEFTLIRVGAVFISLICIVYLIVASEYPARQVDDFSRAFAYISMAYVPLVSLYIYLEFRKIRCKFSPRRYKLDNKYVECVNALW